MTVTNRVLAQALIKTVERHPTNVLQICENFIEYLRINRRLRSLPHILRNLEEVAEQRFGYKKAIVASRFPLSPAAKRAIEQLVRKQTGAAVVLIEEQLDENLIGGARVRFGDTVVDLSVKIQLGKLTEQSYDD